MVDRIVKTLEEEFKKLFNHYTCPYDEKWVDYCKSILPAFTICKGKHVLEIACAQGFMFPLAQILKPASHTTIEPNATGYRDAVMISNLLEYDIDVYNIAYEDMKFTNKFDVIISTGLAYHLLHPFHLIETIANMNPEYVIFETTGDSKPNSNIGIKPEKLNTFGSRVTNKKSIPWSLVISPYICIEAFTSLNYAVIKVIEYQNASTMSKHNVTALLLKRLEK